MKILNDSKMNLVHRGEDWPFQQSPCTKEMMLGKLERNEKYISWLQPKDKNRVEDQVPALRINGQYYMLSLRMMKCVWRHVRLHKGFRNYETALYGGKKLRIPMALYTEKIRTQKRFNMMRLDRHGETGNSKKSLDKGGSASCNQNASSKISHIVHRVLIPLSQAPLGSHVSFSVDQADLSTGGGGSLAVFGSQGGGGGGVGQDNTQDIDRKYIEFLLANKPDSVKDKETFLERMSVLFDDASNNKKS